MLKSFCIAAVFVLSAFYTLINASEEQPPAPAIDKPTSEKLAAIIKKLDSNVYKERKQAGKELVKLIHEVGLPLEAPLKEYLKNSSAEVKQAIEKRLDLFAALDLRDYQDIIKIFDSLKLPDVKGLKFVRYNTGEYSNTPIEDGKIIFKYELGWVVSESNASIVIYKLNLATAEFDRTAVRKPGNRDALMNKLPKDRPLPGEYMELDWNAFCKSQTAAVGENLKDLYTYYESITQRVLPPPVEAALFGYWTYRRGCPIYAYALFKRAKESFSEYNNGREHFRQFSDAEFFPKSLCAFLRAFTADMANRGVSFEQLSEIWGVIKRTDPKNADPEAEEMVKFYKEMAKDEKKRKVLSEGEIKKLPAPKRVEYWMYNLRNLNLRQNDSWGDFNIFADRANSDDRNPAAELVKIGMDALPSVIEHIDDRRPTRCAVSSGRFTSGSLYLLRYGDVCQKIFSAITEKEIYDNRFSGGCMTQEGKEAEVKKVALEWWNGFRELGIDKTVFNRLESPSEDVRAGTARELINRDPKKYIPNLIKYVNGKSIYEASAVIRVVAESLDNSHRADLMNWLPLADLPACCIVAQTLAEKCASDAGAKELYSRIFRMSEADSRKDVCYIGWAMEVITKAPGDFPENATLTLMDSCIDEKRIIAINAASYLPVKRIIAKLLEILDDKSGTGYFRNSSEIRICDLAVNSLRSLLAYSKYFPEDKDAETKDGYISDLKKYISENIDKFDWAGLKKSAHLRREHFR